MREFSFVFVFFEIDIEEERPMFNALYAISSNALKHNGEKQVIASMIAIEKELSHV